MIKLKSILTEQTDPNLGFAKYIVGNLMEIMDPDLVKNGVLTYKIIDRPAINKLLQRIKTQAQYDAVLKLCKNSKPLQSKYPIQYPFYTVMELIQAGMGKATKDPIEIKMIDRGIGSDYYYLQKFASYLSRFNPDEEIIYK